MSVSDPAIQSNNFTTAHLSMVFVITHIFDLAYYKPVILLFGLDSTLEQMLEQK